MQRPYFHFQNTHIPEFPHRFELWLVFRMLCNGSKKNLNCHITERNFSKKQMITLSSTLKMSSVLLSLRDCVTCGAGYLLLSTISSYIMLLFWYLQNYNFWGEVSEPERFWTIFPRCRNKVFTGWWQKVKEIKQDRIQINIHFLQERRWNRTFSKHWPQYVWGLAE